MFLNHFVIPHSFILHDANIICCNCIAVLLASLFSDLATLTLMWSGYTHTTALTHDWSSSSLHSFHTSCTWTVLVCSILCGIYWCYCASLSNKYNIASDYILKFYILVKCQISPQFTFLSGMLHSPKRS